MSNQIILSICIASYNHGLELFDKVKQLLEFEDRRFQIVVSDNCSTDGTKKLFAQLQDDRLKFIEGDCNIGPVRNYLRALANGDGKYILFVTDKDYLLVNSLYNVIELLSKVDFSVGYFVLDMIQPKKCAYHILGSRLKSFEQIAYLSKHPTGYIFNRQLMNKIGIEEKFSNVNIVGYFPFEFICAELCMYANAIILSIPFCITAKIKPNGGTQSATYSQENNNLFFEPKARFQMFENYVKHLNTLCINKAERTRILRCLCFRTFIQSTYAYKNIIENKDKCLHYKTKSLLISDSQIKSLVDDFNHQLKQSHVFIDDHEARNVINISKRQQNLFKMKKYIYHIFEINR